MEIETFSTPVVILGDSAAVGVILSALAGWLPPIAGVIAIVWYLIQISESRTVRTFLQRRAQRRIIKLRAKLAAMQLSTTASYAATELKAEAAVVAKDLKANQA